MNINLPACFALPSARGAVGPGTRLLRKPRSGAARCTVATLIALLVRHATYIPRGLGAAQATDARTTGVPQQGRDADGRQGTRYPTEGDGGAPGGGLMATLVEIIGERTAPGRATEQSASVRQCAMAALGELLYYAVTQDVPPGRSTVSAGGRGLGGEGAEAGRGCGDGGWCIPVAAVRGAIRRCLDDAESEGVRHHAAKTIENVLAQARPWHALVESLVSPEVALRLLEFSRWAPVPCPLVPLRSSLQLQHGWLRGVPPTGRNLGDWRRPEPSSRVSNPPVSLALSARFGLPCYCYCRRSKQEREQYIYIYTVPHE